MDIWEYEIVIGLKEGEKETQIIGTKSTIKTIDLAEIVDLISFAST